MNASIRLHFPMGLWRTCGLCPRLWRWGARDMPVINSRQQKQHHLSWSRLEKVMRLPPRSHHAKMSPPLRPRCCEWGVGPYREAIRRCSIWHLTREQTSPWYDSRFPPSDHPQSSVFPPEDPNTEAEESLPLCPVQISNTQNPWA